MARSAFEEAREMQEANTPGKYYSGYQGIKASGGFNSPPSTIDLSAIGQGLFSAANKIASTFQSFWPPTSQSAPQPPQPAKKMSLDEAAQQMTNQGWKLTGATPSPSAAPTLNIKDIESKILTGYKQLGGATPELMSQVPVMAKQIVKNPYLYPIYPAIPYAETSLGKNVTYPGNYYNWGVRVKPYPLTNYSPDYITERVAYRLTTEPRYQQFRDNPTVQALQAAGYAPVEDNNPHWYENMRRAIEVFPALY